jgi:hypothetical protein
MIEACIGPVLFLVWTAICAGLGLLPEIVMYLTYHLIAPEDFWQKLAVLGLFYLGGAGLCLIFGLLFSSLWAFGIANWGK